MLIQQTNQTNIEYLFNRWEKCIFEFRWHALQNTHTHTKLKTKNGVGSEAVDSSWIDGSQVLA